MSGNPHSPYWESGWRTRLSHESVARNHMRILRDAKRQTFYTTVDLRRYLPRSARWLPQVTAIPHLHSAINQSRPTRVLFAPMQGWWKGSRVVDPVLGELATEGSIEYLRAGSEYAGERRSVGALPHEEYLALLDSCDVFVDQLMFDVYGVSAIEALVRGKGVVGHLGASARLLPETPPIWSSTPDNFRQRLLDFIETLQTNRDAYATRGREYVLKYPSGHLTGRTLLSWLWS